MSKSGTTATFAYNADGLRIRKTVGSTVTKYTLRGKNIVHMTQGSNTLHFWYDAQNRPAIVQFNGTKYGYIHNLQGDVIGLIDSNGTEVVKYVYDAWGKILSTTGTLASTLGAIQPFRYRSYVYDQETGLYYLRSRYYNASLCRFFNTDKVIANKNLFAYCSNKPVYMTDTEGTEERRSESSGDITNFVRDGFFMMKIQYTVDVKPYSVKKDVVDYVLFIPYNHIQYYNNALLFECESPIDKLGKNLINEAMSAGQDTVASLIDEVFNAGRAFSFVMMTLGLITDYIDDSAESARKANHHAAAQSATDKRSYMVVVISQVRTRIWTKNFWSIGRYENYGVEFTTKYYELSEYFEMLKE